jgi:hypothetical protein
MRSPLALRCHTHQKELTMQSMLGLIAPELAGPLSDFVQKLSGSDAAMWLIAFKRFLRKENPWPKFAVRFVVTLGLHKSPDGYKQAIEADGKKISQWGLDILQKVKCSKKHVEVYLAVATVKELGLPNGGTTDQLHAAIKVLGGQLCPSEVGPALRLLCKDQPKDEWLWLAMEAISDSVGGLDVFRLNSYSDGLWLFTGRGHPGNFWNPARRIVFIVPAQVS